MRELVKRISDYLAFIGLGGLILLSLVIIFDIMGREILGIPIPGFSDLTGQLVILSAAACFPASFADRSHISVRFVGQLIHWRGREVLDLLGSLATLVVLGILAYQVYVYSKNVWANNETTWLIGLPIWPVWWTVTVLLTVSFLIQIFMTGLQVRRVFSSEKLADLDAPDDETAWNEERS